LQMVEEREIFFRDYALQSIARNRKADWNLGKKPSRLRCCIGPKKTKSALQQTATKGLVLRLTIQSDREKELVVASKYACMQETIQFARHHENRLGPKLFNSSVITFLS
jgi:hypothetical protein